MSETMSRRGLLKIGAGVAAASVPALAGEPSWAGEGRFNLASPSYSILWKNPLHDPTVMQSFAFDDVNGHIYAAQVQRGSDTRANGHLTVTKMSRTGTELAHMTLRSFGHGVSIAVEPVGGRVFLWTEVDAVRSPDDYAWGRKIARFPFQPGRQLDKDQVANKYELPNATSTTPSIDPTTKRLGIRHRVGGRLRYTVYDLERFKAGNRKPIYDFGFERPGSNPQGWTICGDFLYTLEGHAYGAANRKPGNTYITCVDMRTARQVHRSFSQAGSSLDYREPEGMAIQVVGGRPRLCFGFASGTADARRASIWYKSARM
ncbi:hypothetical protein [Nonomuraea longicatena]|uniref:P68 RBP/TagC-like beta-propeller domain-containing protein n=1 Tax=Nonomuraea longicatena TaxID=83682 RepID=A0ABP4ACR1_9ACTN